MWVFLICSFLIIGMCIFVLMFLLEVVKVANIPIKLSTRGRFRLEAVKVAKTYYIVISIRGGCIVEAVKVAIIHYKAISVWSQHRLSRLPTFTIKSFLCSLTKTSNVANFM